MEEMRGNVKNQTKQNRHTVANVNQWRQKPKTTAIHGCRQIYATNVGAVTQDDAMNLLVGGLGHEGRLAGEEAGEVAEGVVERCRQGCVEQQIINP